MSWIRQSIFSGLVIIMVADKAWAQPSVPPTPGKSVLSTTNLMPPIPTVQSPVSFFRQLLMASQAERNQLLGGRTPESRARIMDKVKEYLALNPDERELRLQATELRWYLLPLMHLAPADREVRLEAVPAGLRELAKSRLAQWDQLPPALQQEFLANEKTLPYFAQTAAHSTPANPQQQRTAKQLDDFFSLTPAEKQQVLGTLSETERAQMEKTLKTFEQLPPHQRQLCIRNYTTFAGMNGTERAEFLKNAESWSKMSPQERQTWRDLVAHVPMWPPVPPTMPPLPPSPQPRIPKPNMATN